MRTPFNMNKVYNWSTPDKISMRTSPAKDIAKRTNLILSTEGKFELKYFMLRINNIVDAVIANKKFTIINKQSARLLRKFEVGFRYA